MPGIGLTDYIKPKNDAFTGMVQASQVLGGGGDGTLPDACVAESNVTQHISLPVTIANGGSGQTTQQAAIDALTAVSGATNEHVLTKDTASGNAVFKAAAGGGGDTHPIADSTAIVKGSADATKLVRVEADGITTATTRVLTMADQDVDLTPDSGTYPAAAHASRHMPGGADILQVSATDRFLGRDTAGAGNIEEITSTAARAILNVADGADVTGSNPPQAHAASHQNAGGDEISVAGLSGLLADDQHVLDAEVKLIKLDDFATPDDNTDLDFSTTVHGLVPKGTNVGDFLKDDGTWATVPGGGAAVSAAAVLADNAVTRGDGGARGIQDSSVLINDSNEMSGLTKLTVDNLELDGDTITNATSNLTLVSGTNLPVLIPIDGIVSDDVSGFIIKNDAWHTSSMVDTRTSFQFWQATAGAGGHLPAGKFVVGTENATWNTTASTRDAYMAFFTSLNGSLVERLRISSVGKVTLTAGVGVDSILDEDDLVSDDADALATQQSIKAYVDASPAGPSNALLDAVVHNDTVAAAVARGSLVYGNATPKWAALAIGAAGAFLYSDGADVSWNGTVITAAAVMADNAIVRGDGVARGIQKTGILINDSDEMSAVAKLTTTGAVGINTTDPGGYIATNLLDIRKDSERCTMGMFTAHNTTASKGSSYYGGRARGSIGGETIVLDGDTLFAFVALGYDGGVWRAAAQIIFTVDGTPASAAVPTQIAFRTGPTAATIADRLTVQSDGDILVDSDSKMMVRDPDLYLSSPSDGQLNVVADVKLLLSSATVQVQTGVAFDVTGLNGINFSPGLDVDVDLITVDVTGAPTFKWDEATDAFELNKGLTIAASTALLWSSYASVTTTATSTADSTTRDVFDEDNYSAYTSNANVTASGITYTSTDGRFTLANAGTYVIIVTWLLTANANGLYNLVIQKNGADIYRHDVTVHTAVDPAPYTVSLIHTFSAGQYVNVLAGSVGIDQTTFVDGCTMSIHRIA